MAYAIYGSRASLLIPVRSLALLIMLMAAAISFSLSGNINISFNKHSLMICEQNRIFFLFNLQNDENVSVF